MKIGIQPDKIGNQSYSNKWSEFLHKRSVSYEFINLLNVADLKELESFDGIMWHWSLKYPDRLVGPKLFEIIGKTLCIPTYPQLEMIFAWDDKIKQNYLFKIHGISAPETWVFYDQESAMSWIDHANYPIVFKLSTGASSSGVVLLKKKTEASKLINLMFNRGIRTNWDLDSLKNGNRLKPYFRKKNHPILPFINNHAKRMLRYEKNYVMFQEYIPGNAYDVRIVVIGNRAFGFRRYNRDNDFRASGSGKFDHDPEKIDLSFIDKAFEISRKLNVHCMAYDFIKKEEEIILLEMCWTFIDWIVQKCPGYWDDKLRWNPGHYWPEQIQIEDFIIRLQNRIG